MADEADTYLANAELTPTDGVSFRKRIAGQAVWVLVGQAASAIGTLVGLRLVTGVVPPSVYGIVVLAVGVVALAQGLAVLPTTQAALRYYPEYERDDECGALRRTVTAMLRRPVMWSSLAVAVVLGIWSFKVGSGFAVGPICGFLFIVDCARTVEAAFLNAAARQRMMAALVATDAWLRPLTAVLLVSLCGTSAVAVIAGYALGAGIALGVYHLVDRSRRPWRETSEVSSGQVQLGKARLWAYARPLTLIPLIGWVSGQADRFVVGGIVGLGAAGVYAALYGLASRPFLMLGNAVELSLRQTYYTRVTSGDRSGQRRVLMVWLGAVSGACLLALLAIALLHRQIAGVLLAPEYRSSSQLMVWIAVGYFLYACSQVIERVCYAMHDTSGVLIIQIGGALAGIVVTVPMVLAFGMPGAAWAVPIYFGIQLLLATFRASFASQRLRAQEGAR